jgi:hypothetical protein
VHIVSRTAVRKPKSYSIIVTSARIEQTNRFPRHTWGKQKPACRRLRNTGPVRRLSVGRRIQRCLNDPPDGRRGPSGILFVDVLRDDLKRHTIRD